MTDLLQLIHARLVRESRDFAGRAATLRRRLAASRGHDSRPSVEALEALVAQRGPAAFRFDSDGFATLRAGRSTLRCGRFTSPTLAELDAAAWRPRRIHLVVVGGTCPLLDIGALQAWSAKGTLFQVASQFNALESPGPYVSAIADYYSDPTQGPRASISALPGTLLRQYAAPGPRGRRFVQQSNGPQIDLLEDAIGAGRVLDGYLLGESIRSTGGSAMEADAIARRLQSRFRRIRVGLHEATEVMLGHDWHGRVPTPRPRIDQVFTSTIAGGQYGGHARLGRVRFERVAETLLQAAYLGTLRSAIALDRDRVVLTLVGGGVFGNPLPLIWRSILWAASQCELQNVKRSGMALPTRDLEVFVNARDSINALREIGWSGEAAAWKPRVSWVEFGPRHRVQVEVAAERDRSRFDRILGATPVAFSRKPRGGAAVMRMPRDVWTPERCKAARVPLWIREVASAARRDRGGSSRERVARFQARMQRMRPLQEGDVSVSWSGDFDAVDLMLQRRYPKQYARDPDRQRRRIRLVFGSERRAARALPTLKAHLRRIEAEGLIRSVRASVAKLDRPRS